MRKARRSRVARSQCSASRIRKMCTIMEMLQKKGAVVSYNDPHIPTLPHMRHHTIRLDSQPLTREYLQAQDCVLIVTDHAAYDYQWIIQNCRLLVDTRNATAGCIPGEGKIWKA